jgi:hypothetical protein
MVSLFLVSANALAEPNQYKSNLSDDDFDKQVTNQLDLAAEALGAGFGLKASKKGELAQGKSETVGIKLPQGKSYVVAVCDKDCGDLDIRVSDKNGNTIGEDLGDDDLPYLELNLNDAASYKVEAIMQKCSDAPCSYGIGSFVEKVMPK